jgi:hypothetical protein
VHACVVKNLAKGFVFLWEVGCGSGSSRGKGCLDVTGEAREWCESVAFEFSIRCPECV